MTLENRYRDCIVIGAGISGLLAATTLQEGGLKVLLLDKGRGVGGRMATRRIDDYRFDHGAQAITCHTEEFTAIAKDWLDRSIVKPCDYPLRGHEVTARLGPICGVTGMTAVPKDLASRLDVRTSTRVQSLRWSGTAWEITADEEALFYAELVLVTAPAPQSLDILNRGKVALPPETRSLIEGISYEPCIALMAAFDPPQLREHDPIVRFESGFVELVSDNHAKGVSQRAGAITVHGSAAFSKEYWDQPDTEVASTLFNSLHDLLPDRPLFWQIHKWKFGQAATTAPFDCVTAEVPGLIAFAGDGFSGGGIEGAALSGIHAAREILSRRH